ncbi:MAG: cysteine--tRNA ligase [Candidatus Altiarchaeota archaeon]
MTLKVFNTLTRQKEKFIPLKGKRVNMFVCGPTVYDFSHLGHARTYVAFDVIARYLRYKGYSVFYLMNITDIDDKIINRANEKKISAEKLAEEFLIEFFKDIKALKIESVNLYQKATDFIPEIISQVNGLVEKGYAYEVNGDVYYEVKKFSEFGKLSKQSLEELIAGARVEVDKKKKNPEDFVLWKKQKKGEPFWNSPWSNGRPGWHIEDTAISITHFGEQYDIHGGAIDLIFPHHEAEIAIAESLTGKKPFVKYWLHTGFLKVNGEKMSKSLGNFITIRELLKRYDAMVLRFFLLYTHYRSPIDFTYEFLDEAKNAWQYIKDTFSRIEEITKVKKDKSKISKTDKKILLLMKKTKDEFIKSMDDDFNTREAISKIFDFTREVNKFIDEISETAANKILNFYIELCNILGLEFYERKESSMEDKLIQIIVMIREKLRAKKDFETSDLIREKLKEIGIILGDDKGGVKVIKKY